MISVNDIGKIAAAILASEDWSTYNGRSMILSGRENVSDAELAKILAKNLGRPIRHHQVSEQEMAKMFFGESVPTEIVGQMEEFNKKVKEGEHTLENLPTDPALVELHKPEVTMKKLVEDNIELFR